MSNLLSTQRRIRKQFAMAGEASAMMTTLETIQALFALLYPYLGFCDITCPPVATISNETYVDYLIIGAGSAGCVLGNRLSENESVSVMMIEAGGIPSMETTFAGMFTLEPKAGYDWNYRTVNDGYTAQNLQNNSARLTAGKMVGGSSGLHHMIYYRGDTCDYAPWAAAVNDSSWNYTALGKYRKKIEKMVDPTILNSTESCSYGKSGNMKMTKEPSELNVGILEAMAELGYEVKIDIGGKSSIGVGEPILNIADCQRQSGNLAYLSPIRNRSNLKLVTYATVTHILFDSNNVAIGAKYVDSSGVTYVVYANKEVIISAGVIGSPNILLHSGIGPQSHLDEMGINVKADLPVGENLQDHSTALFCIALNSTTAATAADPHLFPVPLTTSYKDYDGDGCTDYSVISIFLTPKSAGFLQVCLNLFKYTVEVCQKIYDAGGDNDLFCSFPHLSHPWSTGRVYLNTTEPLDPPNIYLGTYSNSKDLSDMSDVLQDYAEILNTTYFKGAKFLDLGFCNNTTFGSKAYWKCYALSMSAAMGHLSGTCSMGTVLDNRLRVQGVQNLRVVDGSAMNSLTSGVTNGATVTLAEKAADMIIEDQCA